MEWLASVPLLLRNDSCSFFVRLWIRKKFLSSSLLFLRSPLPSPILPLLLSKPPLLPLHHPQRCPLSFSALLLALAPLFDMTVNGLWPAINACVEPTLAKVTNRIATAAHYLFSQIAQRQAVQNPPAPPPRRTDPQDSEDENDDGMNGGLEGDDGQEQSPPPAQPFAPVASTSDLNRQPPFRAPSPASSLSSLPSSKSSHTEDDPPEVPPLPPPTPPTHHIFEVAPYEEAEKTAMLAHPVTSSQPLEKFMDQLLIQVLIRLMLVQEDWGRQFPNIRIGWIFEGDSTKEKEQKLKERVKKEGEAQVKGDWKEQQRERIKARRAKKRLKKAESIARKRIAQNGGIGGGDGDEMDEEEEDCEQELDEGGEEVDEEEDIGRSSLLSLFSTLPR